jgi:hypothetical protein
MNPLHSEDLRSIEVSDQLHALSALPEGKRPSVPTKLPKSELCLDAIKRNTLPPTVLKPPIVQHQVILQ